MHGLHSSLQHVACSLLHVASPPNRSRAPPPTARQAVTGQQLPADFQVLFKRAGLRSFVSALIAAGSRCLGCITIAARDPLAFEEPWWQPIVTLSGSALLPHLRNRQLASLCRMLVAVETEADAAQAASLVIHVSARRLLMLTHKYT